MFHNQSFHRPFSVSTFGNAIQSFSKMKITRTTSQFNELHSQCQEKNGGVERFLIPDINNPGAADAAQSNIWIAADQISQLPSGFNHIPGGSNVLYLDGHVDFIRYEEGVPCYRSFASVVEGVQN